MAADAWCRLAHRRSTNRSRGDRAVIRRLADRAEQHVPDQPLRAVGLHQVANNLTGHAMPTARFRTPLYYKIVRPPLYLRFIIAFSAAPTMTVGHLLFAAVTTANIFVGILLEERDLVDLFGDEYRRYRDRVPILLPWCKLA